jgi:hypothetical protein
LYTTILVSFLKTEKIAFKTLKKINQDDALPTSAVQKIDLPTKTKNKKTKGKKRNWQRSATKKKREIARGLYMLKVYIKKEAIRTPPDGSFQPKP